MIEPFKCKPIYKEKVWGALWLGINFQRNLPEDLLIGESWELACREDAMSVVDTGSFAGKTLSQLIDLYPIELLGERVISQGIDPFPLLIKFLDANDRLSVQVHPDDQYYQLQDSNKLGKTEMWYVLDAEPDAKLILGLKAGTTPAEFKAGIEAGVLDKYLNQVKIKAGDAFFIASGTVHAILAGARIAEIQQNSDTTFRIYDWNRLGLDNKPRSLHINEALAVTNFQLNEINANPGIIIANEGWQRRILAASSYFAVEELSVTKMESNISPERFEIWMVIEGNGELSVKTGSHKLSVGETWMLPASLGKYQLLGETKILRIYIPDLQREIVDYLLANNFTRADFKKIGGLENR